jgi:hypothetical protein
MFIEPLSFSRTKRSAKGSNRVEKSRFPRETGPLRIKRFFRPLDFPKKTRRGPEGSIREDRENAERRGSAFPRFSAGTSKVADKMSVLRIGLVRVPLFRKDQER